MANRPAAFFDRDGVLNQDIGYLYRKEDFAWIDGAIRAIRYCNDRGYYVFVVTNQGGIARGYYGEADVQALHCWMNQELAKHSAHIDEFFYCPHHTEGIVKEYTLPCECRKPGTKMLERAFQKYSIDKERSLMIGDKDSDVKCAANAGIRGVKFIGGNLYEVLYPYLAAEGEERNA